MCLHKSLPPRELFHFFKHITSGTSSVITTDTHITLHAAGGVSSLNTKVKLPAVTNYDLLHFPNIAEDCLKLLGVILHIGSARWQQGVNGLV